MAREEHDLDSNFDFAKGVARSAPTTWFTVGYDAGLEGQAFKAPENSYARASYRLGFDQGDLDRTLIAAGYKPVGRNEPR